MTTTCVQRAKAASVLLAFTIFASFASASLNPMNSASRCGRDLQANNQVMSVAIQNLSSFEAVHTGLQILESKIKNAEFCVSGLILSRNIYQLGKYLVQVEVREAGTSVVQNRLYFLYQDSSVQAIHNFGLKPYIALPAAKVDQILGDAVTNDGVATLQLSAQIESLNVAVMTSKTLKTSQPKADLASLSAIVVPKKADGDAQSLLVSWLTEMPANPYAGYALLKGISLTESAEGLRLVEFRPFSQSLDVRLSDLQDETQAQIPRVPNQLEAMVKKMLEESKL